MRDYKKIDVWKRSHALVLRVYDLTQTFPPQEKYGIGSQLQRAVVSIPTNIPEGCGRTTEAELVRFMDIASGSASEIDYLLYLAMELK
ncbi:MAG: four helix bundle protein [Planctomycetaceae bacterium]|nr:four helix bundle protein [Planctomycetaceae bacterium]